MVLCDQKPFESQVKLLDTHMQHLQTSVVSNSEHGFNIASDSFCLDDAKD